MTWHFTHYILCNTQVGHDFNRLQIERFCKLEVSLKTCMILLVPHTSFLEESLIWNKHLAPTASHDGPHTFSTPLGRPPVCPIIREADLRAALPSTLDFSSTLEVLTSSSRRLLARLTPLFQMPHDGKLTRMEPWTPIVFSSGKPLTWHHSRFGTMWI